MLWHREHVLSGKYLTLLSTGGAMSYSSSSPVDESFEASIPPSIARPAGMPDNHPMVIAGKYK